MAAALPALKLSGAPSSLRAPLPPGEAHGNAALLNVTNSSGEQLTTRSISLVRGEMRLRVAKTTAPGRYEGRVDIAGSVRPIQIDVTETIALSIRPSPLVVDRTSGHPSLATVTFENRGNVPLTIDVAGDYPLGIELPLSAEAADRTPAAIFAGLLGAGTRPSLQEIGTITLTMPGGAIRIDAGSAQSTVIGIALPEGLIATARYRAFIPVYTENLELVAITAAKTVPPKERPRPRNRGASI